MARYKKITRSQIRRARAKRQAVIKTTAVIAVLMLSLAWVFLAPLPKETAPTTFKSNVESDNRHNNYVTASDGKTYPVDFPAGEHVEVTVENGCVVDIREGGR